MAKKGKKKPENVHGISYIRNLAIIIKEVGFPGFLAATLVFIFLAWGTDEQKREFIDLYILQKHMHQNLSVCVITISSLVLLIIMGGVYFGRLTRLRKEENNRIGKEKSELQQLLTKKALESSD